ncbi:nicotinamidase-related amidase [Paraburkholderia bannensis]|uniref:Nicotinamidase-related amidase n=1 Tax=Paraburkholderia bannensis TaxID=765414 RepID=A0A7W9U2K0_9BURK|nr:MULTISPECIES: cysteine hydrolase family protein [Paraburkholderia]MBB3260701.1 nicotinamidase-related amidase [Paraburkholderia sp. WP4_3_2]MBB6105871.1 nicotinamidase-related amidase [Paraburkholderia bannensis]
MQASASSRRALLIVDMQVGLFNGNPPPYEGARVLANINMLIARARAAGAPIYAARHTGPAGSPIAPDSELTKLVSGLDVDDARDTVFVKTRPNCFIGTELRQWLAEDDVGELAIVGMKTQYCVDTTCRAVFDLGLRAVLIEDAHTTVDTPDLHAREIIAHHNRTLNGPFVALAQSAAYEF